MGGRDPPKSANGIGPSASPNAARWVQSRETGSLRHPALGPLDYFSDARFSATIASVHTKARWWALRGFEPRSPPGKGLACALVRGMSRTGGAYEYRCVSASVGESFCTCYADDGDEATTRNRQRVGTPSARARQHPRRPVGAGSLRIVTAVKPRGFAGAGRCSGDS